MKSDTAKYPVEQVLTVNQEKTSEIIFLFI